MNYKNILKNGLLDENPVFRLVLGCCPTLAVTTSAWNGIGMGLSTLCVLVCSNVLISALKKIIPHKVRIPAYIIVIASFVTIIQLLLKAYIPDLDKSLGIFIPLIVVNCLILARAETFASKQPILSSLVDGFAMGLGFTISLFIIGSIREILGAGTLTLFTGFSLNLFNGYISPALVMIMAPGGFLVFGILIGILNKFSNKKITSTGCKNCNAACKKLNTQLEES